MKNSSRFFANTDCEYYPCHSGQEPFNCLFCYCPFYAQADCPGAPSWIRRKGKLIKDCSACIYPHKPENYDSIIDRMVQKEEESK